MKIFFVGYHQVNAGYKFTATSVFPNWKAWFNSAPIEAIQACKWRVCWPPQKPSGSHGCLLVVAKDIKDKDHFGSQKKKMHTNMKCRVVRTLCLLPRTSWTATGECALSRPDGQNILWFKPWAGHLPLCNAPEILILMPRHNIKGRGSVLYFRISIKFLKCTVRF